MKGEEKRREELLDKLKPLVQWGAFPDAVARHKEARRLLSAHDAGIWEAAAKVCEDISEAWNRKRPYTDEGEREKQGGVCAAAECADALRAQKGASDGA